MREDRPKTYARNGRRPSAAPYNTLRDRISSPASPERPPIVFPGRPDVKNIRNPKPDPTDRSSSSDNPLYSYLDGKKSARTTSRDAWRASNVQAPDRDFTQTRECSQLPPARQRERDSPADGLSIRGHGEVANAFNIRGASSTSVTIKNLAPGTTEADVCHILNRQIGEVESCTTFHVRGGLSTTAEVKFGSRVAADNAIRTFHGVLADNKRLDVSILVLPSPDTYSLPSKYGTAANTATHLDGTGHYDTVPRDSVFQPSIRDNIARPRTGEQASTPRPYSNGNRRQTDAPGRLQAPNSLARSARQ